MKVLRDYRDRMSKLLQQVVSGHVLKEWNDVMQGDNIEDSVLRSWKIDVYGLQFINHCCT